MSAIKEILGTAAVVLGSILGLVFGLYLLLLFVDWWLKFKSGSREQEGLSNLLVDSYKDQTRSHPDGDGKDASDNEEQARSRQDDEMDDAASDPPRE